MDKDLTFQDWLNYIKNQIDKEHWITVYTHNRNDKYEKIDFRCALIPNKIVDKVLNNKNWDEEFLYLINGDGYPGYVTHYTPKEETKYVRFGNEYGVEPLIFFRNFYSLRESYKEISEEFRHYHNLYNDAKNNRYIKFNDEGDEEEVISLNKTEIKIRLKHLKEFLAAKNMKLTIYFEIFRFSSKSLSDLKIKKTSKVIRNDNYIYHLYISNPNWNPVDGEEIKSFSQISGKKIIGGLKNFKLGLWSDTKNKDYVDFIVDVNEEGEEVLYTCNPNKLNDNFGKNPEALPYLTPVFFKREVLKEYYSNPDKYSVEDNYIRCGGLWSLRLDNNHEKYIIVWLGDIGGLSIKEQYYLRHYNIQPEGYISKVAIKRAILGHAANPEQSDLLFKYKFESFQKKWFVKFGWYLFKPLNKNDDHSYHSLRIPLIDNHSEFESQVLALTKILIDSLNEKELKKSITTGKDIKGITKLEKFLESKGITNFDNYISLLRNLQKLRSSGVGHRKGEEYKKISSKFHLNDRNLVDVFDDILKNSILLLDFLEERLLND